MSTGSVCATIAAGSTASVRISINRSNPRIVMATETQNVKSTLVVLPFDLKFSSMRYRNSRPYVTAGVMPTFDVSKRRSDIFQFNVADCFLTVGFGCDFYLPFFKTGVGER